MTIKAISSLFSFPYYAVAATNQGELWNSEWCLELGLPLALSQGFTFAELSGLSLKSPFGIEEVGKKD